MWFINTKHFGLRGCDEHMKWGDVQLLTDVNGAEYLEYSERQLKTRTGAEPRGSRNVRAVKPKAFRFNCSDIPTPARFGSGSR